MKIFALLVLAAIMAYASADGKTIPTKYVGDLQDYEGGPIVRIGEYADSDTMHDAGADVDPRPWPTCSFGGTIGNPLCLLECKIRGHKGGYCQGKTCVCTD